MIDSLEDAVVVASLLRDWDNVSVYVLVRASDSDFVNDHCSGVFESVSVFSSVWLRDCVFWTVSVSVSDFVNVAVRE